MKKFFSCVPCSDGFCCAYNSIYKNDPNSRVYIVYDGDDTERSVFFNELIRILKGYDITSFNPFYDDNPDGIYIKNCNTYILSNSDLNRISPIAPNDIENYISISHRKGYPESLKREIALSKRSEYAFYKNSCSLIREASRVKLKIHNLSSLYTDDKRIVNFIKRYIAKNLKDNKVKGEYNIRLLSSLTPLGFKTHYDTIFRMCKTTTDIKDRNGLTGVLILNVIKGYAIKNKIPFIISPEYCKSILPQFIVFPTLKTALTISDENHILPFKPTEQICSSRFTIYDSGYDEERFSSLINAENALLDKSVLSLYKGRDIRFALNYNIKDYQDCKYAKRKAKRLAEKIMN